MYGGVNMRKCALFIFAVAIFAFVSSSFAGIGVDSGSYIINASNTPVLQEGVVNVPVKSLLGKIVNESLDKTKTIQVFGVGDQANLLKEVANLYGYKIQIVESNGKDTANYIEVADMPVSSFAIPDEFANEGVTIDKVLNAFYEVEKSGYQLDLLSNAMSLLTQAFSLLSIPVDIIQSIVNAIPAGDTVSSFVSTVIDLLGSVKPVTSAADTMSVASKDPQYLESLDLIMHPIGQGIIVPMMHALDAVVSPMLPGGTMPAAVTRMLMQVGFPAMDLIFNSMPILRPIAMDFMAPITSNMH
jgi:hypothetical protein